MKNEPYLNYKFYEPMYKPFVIGRFRLWFYKMNCPKTCFFKLKNGFRLEVRGFVFMFGW